MLRRLAFVLSFPILLATLLLATASGQTINEQVLLLLSRLNTWTVLQTYSNGIQLSTFIPSSTTRTLYTNGTDLFWNGSALSGGGSVTTPHNLLSVTHPDTAANAVLRGAILIGNSTPAWSRLAVGASGAMLRSDGTDVAWSLDGTGLTSLNASSLSTGTVPLARITGLLNAQIDAAAAIAWTKLSKTGSSLADLTTRSAADLASGTLADARLSSNVSLFGSTVDTSEITDGAVTMVKLAGNGCTINQFFQWNGSSVQCSTVTPGSGTVTSVALALPAIFTVSGSPVTGVGTLTGTLATQVANRVFAGPTGGADASPTFRALVNADLPLTGIAANTYTKLTINTAGVATAGSAQITLTTDVTGVLPLANGGTGLNAAADDTTPVSSGAAWVAKTLCNSGTTGALQYTTATNLFSCLANVATTDSAQTFTNKTLDVEGTGNSVTTVEKLVVRGGKCQNVTATTDWSLPTSDAAAAACATGSNTQLGTLDYADGANSLSAQWIHDLPGDWTGTVGANIVWFTSATSGDVKWQLATACVATSESGDPAFNAASTVVQTAQGTASRYNEATIAAVTMTGCAAGETLFLKVFRDPADGADTLAATARLVTLELTYRRAQ